MINIDAYKGWVFGLRVYSGFLLISTVFGTVFFLASVKPVTFYFSIICFVFLLFFCCAPNSLIFSRIGKLANYLFCLVIACRFIYEIYAPREFITYTMFMKSHIYVVFAAVLWWMLIRKVMANKVAPTENKP